VEGMKNFRSFRLSDSKCRKLEGECSRLVTQRKDAEEKEFQRCLAVEKRRREKEGYPTYPIWWNK
jgi:hypothetical protein